MEQSIQDALQLLWGHSENPVCAVNSMLRQVWAPDGRAKKYLPGLAAELTASDSLPMPMLPPDETVIYTDAEGEAVSCSIRQLCVPDEPLYLLIFRQPAGGRRFTSAEARSLLRTQTDIGRTAAAQIMQTLRYLRSNIKSDDTETCAWLASAEAACYSLLNGAAHCEEMFWYSAFNFDTQDQFAARDLRPTLRHFAEVTDMLTGSSLNLTECTIGPDLYACMDIDRLKFALLLMFVTTHGGDPRLTKMRFSASREESVIRIVMTFNGSEDEDTVSVLHTPQAADATLAGNEMLLSRFCEVFNAALTRQVLDGFTSCTLEIPAADSQKEDLRQFSSAVLAYDSGQFSLEHVLLSELMHPQDFGAQKS